MEAILVGIEPYEIHGTRYFRIAFSPPDEPGRVSQGRIAAESIYRDAKAGDRVEIRMLLGVIDEVKRLPDAGA